MDTIVIAYIFGTVMFETFEVMSSLISWMQKHHGNWVLCSILVCVKNCTRKTRGWGAITRYLFRNCSEKIHATITNPRFWRCEYPPKSLKAFEIIVAAELELSRHITKPAMDPGKTTTKLNHCSIEIGVFKFFPWINLTVRQNIAVFIIIQRISLPSVGFRFFLADYQKLSLI